MSNELKPRALLSKLFNIHKTGNDLILQSGDSLNDASWGAWFGETQRLLRNENSFFTTCHIDLSSCCWADPLPLLSLALALVEYEQLGGMVSITFPNIPDDKELLAIAREKEDSKEIEQARFLKFLAREGFIDLLANPKVIDLPKKSPSSLLRKRIVKLGAEDLNQKRLNQLKDLPVSLAFERSTCLLPTLLGLQCPINPENTEPLEAIDAWVEMMLFQSIDQSVYDEVPSWAQRGLRYRLMIFLRETLHNVAEHAYLGRSGGLAAVYVRYREGALGEAPPTWARLKKFSKRESDSNQVPLMGKQFERGAFPNIRSGFFELFVLDAGQGLCRSLGTAPSKDGREPLQQTMLSVFDEKDRKRSSSKTNRPTRLGGLYLVRELFTPNEDYFRARDEDTWWGCQLPLKKMQDTFVANARGKEHNNEGIKGLSWTARLSWLEAQDETGNKRPWAGINTKQAQTAVLAEFVDRNYLYPSELIITSIYDSRFSPYFLSDNSMKSANNDNQYLLLLPEPRWMKNHIQDEIKRYLKKNDFKWPLNLIIGDIPSEETVTYLSAIDRAKKFKESSFISVRQVILITRELKVCVLLRQKPEDLLDIVNQETKDFIRGPQETAMETAICSLSAFLRVIRQHDADLIRQVVTRPLPNSRYADFIFEKVDWHNGVIMDGYLDFPQTLTHPLCKEIYSISLQRLKGLFPRHDCQLVALDSLVDSLATRFNAQNHPGPSSRQKKRERLHITIGSIKVSGYTEEAGKTQNSPVFHFFRHPSGKAGGRFLLPWVSPPLTTSESDAKPQFRRVGQTSAIARDGWKAYSLHRFDKTGQSIYEQNPRDSYRAWQEPSRTPMKIGHWSYGGHHEILTINMLLAFDTELDRISLLLGGSLARFTFANLFRVFDVRDNQLNEQGKKLLSAVAVDNYQHLLPSNLGKRKPVLVYPSHAVTDHIINRFLGLFTHMHMETIRSQLIAIMPVRRYRSGSGLQLSGLTLERLRSAGQKSLPVVFFDDAMVSGRTYLEIKRLFHDLSFSEIYTLVLLDRQRLPSSDYIKNKSHVCYWRLDVPTMGGKAHCPLCHAIERVQNLSESIASPAHRDRITSWCQTWKELIPSTQWGDTGLRPIPLNLSKPERKFGITRNPDGSYSQIGGDDQQIRLTNSAGLIAWVTELHSMTSRDDLALAVIKKEKLSSEVRIQLLSCQLLLFRVEIDTSHAKKLVFELLEALWESISHDRHTALAVLTLISCGDEFLKSVMPEFLNSDRLYQLKDRNLDFILLLTLVMAAGRRFVNEALEDPRLEVAIRLLKPSGKPDLYYRLHREIKSTHGKAHSSPLQRLAVAAKDVNVHSRENIMNMLASAAQLQVITKTISWHWIRADSEAHKELATITENITNGESRLRNLVLNEQFFRLTDLKKNEKFKNIIAIGKELLENGEKIHDGLFVKLGINDMKNGTHPAFLEEIEQIINQLSLGSNSDGKIIRCHKPGMNETKRMVAVIKKPDLGEAFVAWDAEIKEAVQDILSNVRHSPTTKIPNPWLSGGNHGETNTAHLWCRIYMTENAVQIEMKNKSKKKKEIFEDDVQRSHSHHIIRELGGKVTYDDSQQDNLLLTTISLPFAHVLQIKTLEKTNDMLSSSSCR